MTTGKPVVDLLREYFECTRYHQRLPRASCARMWHISASTGHAQRHEGQPAKSTACRGCDIGKAHHAGQRHKDAPAVAAVVPASNLARKPEPRLCKCGCGEVLAPYRKHYASLACAKDAGRAMDSLAGAWESGAWK